MRLSRLALRVPKRCQAICALRITPPFSTAKSPSAKLPVSFSQFIALLPDIRLRLFGGLLLESNSNAEKVEVRPASTDDRKTHRRAIGRCARKIDLRDAGEAALAGQAADAFAQGVQLLKRKTLGRRRKRCRRQAKDRTGRQQQAEPGAGFHPHQARGITLRIGHHRALQQGPRYAEGKPRIMTVEPWLERAPGLTRLQNALRALPD